MKPAIVKWTVDLLAPGAVITPTLTNWYAKWEAFHSRRALWPAKPIQQLLDIQQDGSMALEDFFHVRVTPIMDGYDGATDGPLDRMLMMKPVTEVFDMTRVCSTALNLAPPYQAGISRAAWIELLEVDQETMIIQRVRQATINEIAAKLTEMEAPSDQGLFHLIGLTFATDASDSLLLICHIILIPHFPQGR